MAATLLMLVGAAASRPSQNAPDDESPRRTPTDRAGAVERFGGTRRTEQAVADGLAWLAAHQRPDGMWDRVGFEKQCPQGDRCPGAARERLGNHLNVGTSALALLAFLGAGYTHKDGPYAAQIDRGFEYLLAQQQPGGSFAPDSPVQLYNDALATLAVAEALALTRDPVFRPPLRRAIEHLARAQQAGGGWDYIDQATGRNDTSITGWVLMAFKSAAASDVRPPAECVWRMIAHFERAIQADGQVWYSDDGIGVQVDQSTGERVQRFGPAMSAVGLFAHATIGWRLDDPGARRMSRLLLDDPPSYKRLTRDDDSGLHSEYYWYYGTLAMFQRGGEDWRAWNHALRDCIVEYQERPVDRQGRHRHTYGSWPPYGLKWGKWGKMGGRVYVTALNVLTLETYYRYTPAYLSAHGLIGPRELLAWVQAEPPASQAQRVARAARFVADTSEPVLLKMLQAGDTATRAEAAIALAAIGAPDAGPVLTNLRNEAGAPLRERIAAALQRWRGRKISTGALGTVTSRSADAGVFLFDTNGEPLYYGQRVEATRDGTVVATGRVDRRFTAQRAAAATILDGSVQIGDAVRLAASNAAASAPAP